MEPNYLDDIIDAVELIKDAAYRAGVKEATERMEMITLIIPESTTKKASAL